LDVAVVGGSKRTPSSGEGLLTIEGVDPDSKNSCELMPWSFTASRGKEVIELLLASEGVQRNWKDNS